MSSQPNEKGPAVPDALVKELLRSQGLPPDSHVTVNVHTTRVRANRDGTRIIISPTGSSAGRAPPSTRRPSRLVAIVISVFGFVQLAYGMWAGHSDALAASVIHGSESCGLQQLLPPAAATPQLSTNVPCRVERAIVVNPYTSSSRHGTTYRVITVRSDGFRDDTPIAARGAFQFWKRLQPREQIRVQRFVIPGYHLTGTILALADSSGSAMSRGNPDSGAYPNAVAMLMGSLLFVLGMAMYVKAGRAA